MILGRIDDKNTAVQKAGRLAGIVAHCPQYPGQLTWWTDERTANTIAFHNQVVDAANIQRGCSALQAVSRASASVEKPQETPKVPSFKISLQTFDTPNAAKAWWKDPASVETEPHDIRFNITRYTLYPSPDGEGMCIKYRGGMRKIITEMEARQQSVEVGAHITNNTPARIMPVVFGQDLGREGAGIARVMPVIVPDIQSGIASSARVMPVETADSAIKYVVVYKPDAVYKPRSTTDGDSGSVATEE
jgi:hypothetical protein